MVQQQQVDEAGRCALHPGIQLHHLKKNGEWRILLHACPLCVSGLPATGQPVITAATRAAMAAAENRERTSRSSGGDKAAKKKDHGSSRHHKSSHHHHRRKEETDVGGVDGGAAEGGQGQQPQGSAESELPPPQPRPEHPLSSSTILSSEELDKKIRKKKSKHTDHSNSRSGSSGRGRSSATPPSARPRSPSPQSPAMVCKPVAAIIGQVEGGGNANNNFDMSNRSGGGARSSDSQSIGDEFNDFMQYLKRDAMKQQQQQEQESHQQMSDNRDGQHWAYQQDMYHMQQHQQRHLMSQNGCGEISATEDCEYSVAETIFSHDHTAPHGMSTEESDDEEETSDVERVANPISVHSMSSRQQQNHHQMPQHPHNVIPHSASSPPKRQPNQSPNQSRRKSPYSGPPPPKVMPPKSPTADSLSYEASQRRPDPEDTDEYNNYMGINNIGSNTNQGMNMYQQRRYQAHPPPPPPPRPPAVQPPPSRDGYPVQQLQQQPQQSYPHDSPTKVLEQDDVSIMSMSSVTRNVTRGHQSQQHRQQPTEGNNIDDIDSESSESDSEEDPTTSPKQNMSSNKSSVSTASTNATSNKSTISNDNSSFSREINTCDYDERGRCRRHPTVRLRKKQMLRGWKVLLSNCPECCLDEMRRVKEERLKTKNSIKGGSSRSREGGSKSGSRGKKSSSRSKKIDKNPPVSQVNTGSNGGDEFDDTRSVGTASTITISSYTHSSGGSKWQSYSSDNQSVCSEGGRRSGTTAGSIGSSSNAENKAPISAAAKKNNSSTAKVTRMPYTDSYGEHGWYTGQVDASTGTPHGFGTLNYSNGAVYEGEWKDGVSVTPSKTREEPLPSSNGGGGGIDFSPMKGRPAPRHHGRHHVQHHHPARPLSMGHSYLATLNEDGSSSDYELSSTRRLRTGAAMQQSLAVPAPPHQQPQRTVVCGMSWTDAHGEYGVYTGEVNGLNIPDGMGSMRYDAGIVAEGVWRDGEMDVSDEDDGDDIDDHDDEEDGQGFLQGLHGLVSLGGAGGYHHRGGASSVH